MKKNDFMITPTLPNWELIYKELDQNGLQNLQNLPAWIFQQMNEKPTSIGAIDGDSFYRQHWMKNTTVGEMIEQSVNQGFYKNTYFPTDAERKLKAMSPIDIPIDGDNLSKFKNLTVEDMINHSIEKGILNPQDVAPDSARKSASQLMPQYRQISEDMAVGYKGDPVYKGNFPRAQVINGDSTADMEWLSNMTVGDMLKISEDMGIEINPWTDTERKIGRKLPDEMPLNAENINSQLRGLTVEDMINYSRDNGVHIEEIIPDEKRIGVEYAQKDRSIIKDHEALAREKSHLQHIYDLRNSLPVIEEPLINITNPMANSNFETVVNDQGFSMEGRLNQMMQNDLNKPIHQPTASINNSNPKRKTRRKKKVQDKRKPKKKYKKAKNITNRKKQVNSTSPSAYNRENRYYDLAHAFSDDVYYPWKQGFQERRYNERMESELAETFNIEDMYNRYGENVLEPEEVEEILLNQAVQREAKLEEINNKPKKTLKELTEYYATDNQLELDHIIPDAHEEALRMNAEFDRQRNNELYDIDNLHRQALKENKKFDRNKKKAARKQAKKEAKQLQEWEEYELKKQETEKAFYKNKYEPAIQNARANKEQALNETFKSDDYEEYYETATNEALGTKAVEAEQAPTLEELEEQLKKAQQEYDNYIARDNIDEVRKQELYDDVFEKTKARNNHIQMEEYRKKREAYRASQSVEEKTKMDTDRVKGLGEWEKRKARLEAGESVDDVMGRTGKGAQESADQVAKNLKKSTLKNLGHVMNMGFAISDFKDGKEAGKSNLGAALHAGKEFALGEVLGMKYGLVMLAKAAPTMAVSAVEGLHTMSRSMNSVQRRQLFGDSQFMDTQQLATMRQSGMELAKMSQYNLQQTLMGSEAEYLHKL